MWGPAWGQGFVEFGGLGFGVKLGFAFCALALAFFRIWGLGFLGSGFCVYRGSSRVENYKPAAKVREGYMDKRG